MRRLKSALVALAAISLVGLTGCPEDDTDDPNGDNGDNMDVATDTEPDPDPDTSTPDDVAPDTQPDTMPDTQPDTPSSDDDTIPTTFDGSTFSIHDEVRFEDVIVTGSGEGFFIQEPGTRTAAVYARPYEPSQDTDPDSGSDWSFSGTIPSRGSMITIEGQIDKVFPEPDEGESNSLDGNPLVELHEFEIVEVNEDPDTSLPEPIIAEPSEVCTSTSNTSRRNELVSSFIRVESVEVTATHDFAEYSVWPQGESLPGSGCTDGFRVGDLFYDSQPSETGGQYEFIRGPLMFSFGNTKISPRDADDLSQSGS